MMRAGGMSDGRDIGVVFNLPSESGACVLPVCGGVGTQYTPAVGWAQALRYRATVLGDKQCDTSIAVAHGGDASTATNGFWAALNIVTTERLPFLFFIEDNGYGISVPSRQQTPGGNIAENLEGFRGLRVLDGDSADPLGTAALIENAVTGVRSGGGPALIRLKVPRLSGHSGQDTQAYKSAAEIAAERERDPLHEVACSIGAGFGFRRRMGSANFAGAGSRGAGALRSREAPPTGARARHTLRIFGVRRRWLHGAAAAGRNALRRFRARTGQRACESAGTPNQSGHGRAAYARA
jgi:2-oxoisovalerate dehydrogenase E1 component